MPQRKQPTKKIPLKQPSFGVITVIEDGNDIKLAVEVDSNDTSPEDIIERIKAVISGMLYVYDKDRSAVEALGQAYLDGVETGIRNSHPPVPVDGSPPTEEGLSMGFTSVSLGEVRSH